MEQPAIGFQVHSVHSISLFVPINQQPPAEPVVCGRPLEGALRLIEIQLALVLVPLKLLLILDVPASRGLIQPDTTHAVPAGPERSAKQRTLRLQHTTMNPHRTLALQVANRHRNAVSRRNTQQHVYMVRRRFPLHQLDPFLATQISKNPTYLMPNPSILGLLPVLWQDHNMVLALPSSRGPDSANLS